MKYIKFLLTFFISLLFFWFLGFIYFVELIPSKANNISQNTDAIIVLTGGSGRLDTAISLLVEGKANYLLISGVGQKASIKDLQRFSKELNQHDLEEITKKITLGYIAESTVGNAYEAKMWMDKNNYKSITLVTSNYHMPRSLAEFKEIMPHYQIYPYPVISESVKIEKWWIFPGTLKLLVIEYNKYLLHYVYKVIL